MNSLTKEAENLILDSIEDVCQHVSGGDHPTQAVIKVAEERQLSPNFIQLVCTGYNTGATNYQFNKSAETLLKMSEFPIAMVDEVLSTIYPEKPEKPSILKASAAISDEYNRKPVNKQAAAKYMQKLAAEKLPMSEKKSFQAPAADRMAKAYSQSVEIKRNLEVKRADYARRQDDLLLALGKFVNQIKYGHVAPATLEYVANTVYGPTTGKALFDYVSARLPNTKRASAPPAKLVSVDWSADPYKTMADCVKLSHIVNSAAEQYRIDEAKAQEKIAELLLPFEVEVSPMPEKKANVLSITETSEKQANPGFLGGLLGGALTRSLSGAGTAIQPKPTSDLAAGIGGELDDPDHENELRKIQARTMMQDLLQNDEVIAGYDPGEVLDAYNEIVSVTPRSATQAAIMRPLLRKRLTQGAIEPFEATEMLNIEKTLGQTASPTMEPPKPQDLKKVSNDVLRHPILG